MRPILFEPRSRSVRLRALSALLAGIATLLTAARAEPEAVTIDATVVLRSTAHRPIGINLNFLNDADARRPAGSRALCDALRELGVTYLRYPGGEKADTCFFAAPDTWPVTSADAPVYARYGKREFPSGRQEFGDGGPRPVTPLSFDAFMANCRALGAKPVIVLAYDSAYKAAPEGGATPTRQQVIDHAVAWLRYANLTRGWGVNYWEIGNETDAPSSYAGEDPGVERYAADVVEISRAMKALDPSIKIGANALSPKRIEALLAQPGLAGAIDYLSIHSYQPYGWKDGYETYRSSQPELDWFVTRAAAALRGAPAPSPADKARITLALTEFNAIDWVPGGWENVNDLGHALVVFDTIGQNLREPKLEFLQFWNTRWIRNGRDAARPGIDDALTPTNGLTPAGRALSVWGRFLGDEFLDARGGGQVRAYASRGGPAGALTVFLLNKDTRPHEARLEVVGAGFARGACARRWEFAGTSPQDFAPIWAQREALPLRRGERDGRAFPDLVLPPLSVTVLHVAADVAPRSPVPSHRRK